MLRTVVLAAILAPSLARAGDRDMCRRGAKLAGKPVDLDFKDADLHDVMRLLADVGGVSIVVADTVRGRVTLKLKHVAWDRAVCTIAAVHKLTVTANGDVILVRK